VSAEDLYSIKNTGGLWEVTARTGQTTNLRDLSMAGGAEILIKGSKMMSDPTQNIIFYSASGDIEDVISYPVLGSTISEND
jgi:hypothetical protein